MSVVKKEKILIIEGNVNLGNKLSGDLVMSGYTVQVINSGVDAIKVVHSALPNLIVLDIAISENDTYDILTKKQDDPLTATIPLILLSTEGLPINMSKVPENAVTEFVFSMDIDIPDVIKRIDKIFGYTDSAIAAAGDRSAARKRVVWVEDDKLISSILERKFTSSGLDLFHAKNGDEMLAYLATHIPDVIVLDLLLPGMGGFEILQKIRMDKRLKDVPAMILSNLSKPSDIEKAKILGASRFVIKAATSLENIVEEVKGLVR